MILHKDWVFLHLQKTGGMFFEGYLLKNVPGSKFGNSRHGGYRRIPEKYRNNKIIFGTIRNPWEWYVSWYHKLIMGHPCFNELYEGKDFNTFLFDLFNRSSGKFRDLDFGLISRCNIGVLSYRYSDRFLQKPSFKSKSDFLESQKTFFLTDFCLFHSMKQDLCRILNLNKKQREILNDSKSVNTSTHQHYRKYYNEESKNIVYKKDQFLLDNYGFTF